MSAIELIALDVDGTLLDSFGHAPAEIVRALTRASRAGMRVVLCTGRRFRRAAEAADALDVAGPIVCNSGSLIKDPRDGRTLWRADIPPECCRRLVDIFQTTMQPSVCFLDGGHCGHDFSVSAWPTGHGPFDEYVAINRAYACVDVHWMRKVSLGEQEAFHWCGVGDKPEMDALAGAIRANLSDCVRTFVQRSPRHSGWLCEIVRHDADKWTALQWLAESWGVRAASICAIGDDLNDERMIERAGVGVALAHAPEPVRAAADRILPSDEPGAVARLIGELLSS